MTWLDIAKNDLGLVEEKDLIEPDREIGSHEVDTGHVLTLELRKLFTLMQRSKTERSAFIAGASPRARASKEDLREAAVKLRNIDAKAEAINDIFFISVRDEYDLWGRTHIGIRKGWKVIYITFVDDLVDMISNAIHEHATGQ